jgi:hypothetical protein
VTARPAPRRVPRLLVLALATAAALAACGGTPSASPAPSATAAPGSPSPSVAPGSGGPATSATPFPTGSFTFDLPAGWKAIPLDGSHDALLAAFRAQNPTFADSLEARIKALPGTATYLAVNASPAVVAKGDVVTLIVTEVNLPADVSSETFAKTVQSQVKQLVEDDVPLKPVLLSSGQGYSMAYSAPFTRPDGQQATVAVTQVLYVIPGRGYVMTFSAPQSRAQDYAQEIADIATSFTIKL